MLFACCSRGTKLREASADELEEVTHSSKVTTFRVTEQPEAGIHEAWGFEEGRVAQYGHLQSHANASVIVTKVLWSAKTASP